MFQPLKAIAVARQVLSRHLTQATHGPIQSAEQQIRISLLVSGLHALRRETHAQQANWAFSLAGLGTSPGCIRGVPKS